MSRKSNIISTVVAVVIICAAVALCAVAVIRSRDAGKDPTDTSAQTDNHDTETVKVVPIIPPDTVVDPTVIETAEVTLDVMDRDNRPSDTPGIVGEVSVIPGVKDGE